MVVISLMGFAFAFWMGGVYDVHFFRSGSSKYDRLKKETNNVDYDKSLKKSFESPENHNINSFDTRSSSRQHRTPLFTEILHFNPVCKTQ